MPPVSRPSLYDYIDAAMTRTHLDAKAIERQTGVPANWTRQLKSGRMKGRPDPDRLAKVARALGVDEAELWAYFGRADMIAALRSAPVEREQGSDVQQLVAAMTAALLAQTQALSDLRADLAETRQDADEQREAMTRMLARLEAQLAELAPPGDTAAAAVAPGTEQR